MQNRSVENRLKPQTQHRSTSTSIPLPQHNNLHYRKISRSSTRYTKSKSTTIQIPTPQAPVDPQVQPYYVPPPAQTLMTSFNQLSPTTDRINKKAQSHKEEDAKDLMGFGNQIKNASYVDMVSMRWVIFLQADAEDVAKRYIRIPKA